MFDGAVGERGFLLAVRADDRLSAADDDFVLFPHTPHVSSLCSSRTNAVLGGLCLRSLSGAKFYLVW